MEELGLNTNQLTEMLKGKIPRQTIYDFLSGKSDARSEVVSALMEIPATLSWEALVLGVVFSTLVGLIAGIVPARRAAGLQPVESLR